MSIQYRLNLGRIDIQPETDDELLCTTNDEEISIFQPSEVACVEPSVRIETSSCLLGGAIVTLHNIGPAHP